VDEKTALLKPVEWGRLGVAAVEYGE